MTTPDNPYGDPGQNPPPPPSYGAPQYGQPPPAYGSPAPQYGAPAPQYGAPAPYGQAPYGAPPAGNFGGTLVEWPIRVASSLIDAVPSIILSVIGTGSGSGGIYALTSLLSLGYWIWNMIRQGRTGQTIGKSAMGTFLVRESDGQFIGGGLSVLRGIVHIVDVIPCFLGLLWPLWDAKKQTFADKIMGTVVVKR